MLNSSFSLDKLYEYVDDLDKNENMMSVTTPGGDDRVRCNLNLPCGHVYTVLDVVKVYSKDNKSSRTLYKVRNPWKVDADYKGAWRDDAAIWTADGETYDI